ncbi:hypothetical protein PoB_001618000 [Plakobranchus ocellatus]|uniref:Uncharacterized protein n=1 Tax=Plakobranchus ocellatus TaxID=259542 RepID=A0AAV3Z2R1_9GAST|nr:hypothetical protein PoB_001618000 [Plakobranchus ocellatus]
MLRKLNSLWNVRISQLCDSNSTPIIGIGNREIIAKLDMSEANLQVSISDLQNALDRVAWISVVQNEHNAYNMEVTFSREPPSFDHDLVELIKLEAEPSWQEENRSQCNCSIF